jgi:hypothetical protein
MTTTKRKNNTTTAAVPDLANASELHMPRTRSSSSRIASPDESALLFLGQDWWGTSVVSLP